MRQHFCTSALTLARAEAKALTAMDSLRGMMASSCHVVRGGQERVMEPALLVPGDIVRLRLGERVPADVRVLLSRDLKTEQSSITGESDAVAANLDAISEEPLRAGNLLFASSLVVSGEGTALVTRTGKGTLVAGISLLAAGTTVPQRTILQKELDRVVRLMVLAAVLCAALFLAIGLGRREPVGSVIANGVIIAIVVNVQQGLPATLGSCLAVASRRLAASNVLVRRADVVETLGAVTVICSDKTGTLTQNKLSLESVWVAGAAVPASALAQELRATLATPSMDWANAPVAARLLAASALCNTATFGDDPEDSPPHTALELGEPDASKDAAAADAAHVDPVSSLVRTASEAVMPLFRAFSFTPAPPAPTPRGMHGSPLDVALLTYAASVTDVRRLRAGLPPIFVVPFNSAEKWAGVIVPFPGGGGATGPQHLALIKGGPELILARCSSYARPDGTTAPIDDAFRAACAAALATFGGRGERVVGAACSVLPGRPAAEYEADKDAFPLNGHTFLGLLSMADPPRPAVPAAVATLRRAGVRVSVSALWISQLACACLPACAIAGDDDHGRPCADSRVHRAPDGHPDAADARGGCRHAGRAA
jgi:sodium/potassium-transporting ATPase subunit alpha